MGNIWIIYGKYMDKKMGWSHHSYEKCCELPSGYVKITMEKGPVEIVDCSIDSMVI